MDKGHLRRDIFKQGNILRKKYHGGRLLGKGSYGSVYTEPRLPCEKEKFSDIKNLQEVSKLYPNEENREEIVKLHKILSTYFSNKEKKDLDQLIIVPDLPCKLDFNVIRKARDTYNSNWFEDDIHNLYYYKYQAVSKKGVIDLRGKLKEELSVVDFVSILKDTKNIYLGIKAFHDKGFIHADLKTTNVVYHDNKLKLIGYNIE